MGVPHHMSQRRDATSLGHAMWIISGAPGALECVMRIFLGATAGSLERVMCIISGATASFERVMWTILGATTAEERVM